MKKYLLNVWNNPNDYMHSEKNHWEENMRSDNENKIIKEFLKQIQKSIPCTIYKDGSIWKSFTFYFGNPLLRGEEDNKYVEYSYSEFIKNGSFINIHEIH